MPWPLSSTPYPERTPADVDGLTFDYIVVGAGTAGCVVASRLSEPDADGRRPTVLVLEKGHPGVYDAISRIPLVSQNYFFDFMQSVKDRFANPGASFNGKRMRLWSVEGVGGSSRVNAMLMTRGVPGVYEQWVRDFGLDDWAWDKVHPYFLRLENAFERPADDTRGHSGPIPVRQMDHGFKFTPYLERVFNDVGLPTTQDPNSPSGPAQNYQHCEVAIDASSRRTTAYHGYLNKDVALERQSTLSICTGVCATRLDLEPAAGLVKGVYFRPASGSKKELHATARREVIVCNGTLKTPQLLLLSGLGPRAQLDRHGIPVVRDLPAVGRHLQDHICFPVQMKVHLTECLRQAEHWFWGFWAVLMYFIFGRGIMASGSTNYAAFVKSSNIDKERMVVRSRGEDGTDAMDASNPDNVPDFELMVNPINSLESPLPGYPPMLALFNVLLQPFSTGSLELASTDPAAHPEVNYPALDDPRDISSARLIIRLAMRVCRGLALSDYPGPCPLVVAPGVNHKQLIPSPGHSSAADEKDDTLSFCLETLRDVVPEFTRECDTALGHIPLEDAGDAWKTVSDAEVDRFARRTISSGLHYTSTCRMRNDEKDGVVDQRLRVHGFSNLRIADASVFPKVPSCHTMAPTLMIGERCADFVKEAWRERKGR